MANLSDANGRFRILGYENLSEYQIKLFIKMIDEELSGSEYCTILNCSTENIDSFIKSECTCEFFGVGRWFYSNNINYFFEWLNTNENNNREYNDLLEYMDENNIQLEFDYYDLEFGQDPDNIFKEQFVIKVHYDTKEGKYKTKIIFSESETLEANVNILMEIGYIETYYTYKEMEINDTYFYDEKEKEEWFDNYGEDFEDGKYVFTPDLESFIYS